MRRSLTFLMIMGLIAGSGATAEAAPKRLDRLVPAQSGTADQAQALSGTILTGAASGLVGGEPLGCELIPDCRAWLASDCQPALTGRNPALGASIEDVADLAQRSTRWIFEHDPGAAAHAKVQFWGQDCTEIGSARWGTGGCYGCFMFLIPRSAKWMTVTGYTYNPWGTWLPVPDASGPLTFNWTLTPQPRRGRS